MVGRIGTKCDHNVTQIKGEPGTFKPRNAHAVPSLRMLVCCVPL